MAVSAGGSNPGGGCRLFAMWLLSLVGIVKNDQPDSVVARYYHFKRRFLFRALLGTVLCWPGLQWAYDQLERM